MMPEQMSVSRIVHKARIMTDEQADPRLRFDAAKELAQHLYPKCEEAVAARFLVNRRSRPEPIATDDLLGVSRDDIPREPADETEQATEANRLANGILAKASGPSSKQDLSRPGS